MPPPLTPPPLLPPPPPPNTPPYPPRGTTNTITNSVSSVRQIVLDDARQYLYAVGDSRVRKVDVSTGAVTTVASGFSDSPMGVALSQDGLKVYVSTHGPNVCGVYSVDIASGAKTVIAGGGSSYGMTDGPGSSARFSYPRSIYRIGTDLFVADSYNYCIRRIDLSSSDFTVYSDVVGYCTPGGGSGTADGVGTTARFNHPEGLGASPDGSILYVGDTSSNRLRAVELSTRTVTTITSSGLSAPWSIATSADGSQIFVADRGGGQVDQIDAATGSHVRSWSGFSSPYGLVPADAGHGIMYVGHSNSIVSLAVA